MNARLLLVGPVVALLLGGGGTAIAAPSNSEDISPRGQPPHMMQNDAAERMGGMSPKQSGDRMMGYGMGYGMPGNCPMMSDLAQNANSKVMMQMHGEMMRAMGDILIKYADKLDTPSAAK